MRTISPPNRNRSLLIIVALLIIGLLIFFGVRSVQTDQPQPSQWAVGSTANCSRRPTFLKDVDLPKGSQHGMATALKDYIGFVVFDPSSGQVVLHKSWDDGGYLGTFVRDENGNIFTYPSPFSSTEYNDPAAQNIVYKIDSISGEMAPFADLPPLAQPAETVNPYGITSIFYDCDTTSLYIASVMGSTAAQEVGRIFQLSADGDILSTYDNLDVLGIAVYNTSQGKQLIAGSARSTAILSIPLNDDGTFGDDPRELFYLAELTADNDKGQQITFPLQTGNMVIKGLEFDYTLRAAGTAVITDYQFSYDPALDQWDFIDATRREQ